MTQKCFRIFCATMTMLAGSLSAQQEAPAISIEDFLHTDGSRTRAMGFETVPGVLYSVESSDSLSTWTEEIALYGLGQTHNIPMVWIEAPNQTPPPDPPDPPAGGEIPLEFTYLVMKSSSAPEGGMILSWRSLEDGMPLTTVVPGTPDAEWASKLISYHTYGGYAFFVFALAEEAPPSGELPSLGSLDQDMIDAFTNNFAAMNMEMANGGGTSSTTPEPGPTEAGESRFWRVRADWSLDSDFDGSPDWAEFALMEDAGHPSYGVADVYNADVDGDGVADGKTIDLDGDGIVDQFEPTKQRDKVIDWNIQPQPRYAAFPFQGPSPESMEMPDFPHQTNDMGMVLFDEGVWDKGVYYPLEMEGTDVIAT